AASDHLAQLCPLCRSLLPARSLPSSALEQPCRRPARLVADNSTPLALPPPLSRGGPTVSLRSLSFPAAQSLAVVLQKQHLQRRWPSVHALVVILDRSCSVDSRLVAESIVAIVAPVCVCVCVRVCVCVFA
ncbi:MAG: hypothetical protein ACK41O_26950, partial [Runella zeae]